MWWWLKWLTIGSLGIWIGYYRQCTSQLVRSRTSGSLNISTSQANNTESYKFFNQSEQLNYSYFEFENIIYAKGLCGNLQIPPMKRPCTSTLHVHLNQTEFFILKQGQLGYQLDDQIYSCDIHTCPRPLIISPLVPHTFWMNDNKEDLIVIVRLEPVKKYNGLRQGFFENLAGAFRDECASILQLLLFLENAQTYPASLPLPLAKIIVRTGALIGQLFGFQIEYEEYTTNLI